MKRKHIQKIVNNLILGLIIILTWVSITSMIGRFIHPNMSSMEAFLRISQSFILNFK